MVRPDPFSARKTLKTAHGTYTYFDLAALKAKGIGRVDRLPYSIKVLLESILRNLDGFIVTADDVTGLANWNAKAPVKKEIPFMPGRVVLQDFTGVPCVVDLAAMRDAMKRLGGDPNAINPLVKCDMVIDHSVQVDAYGSSAALTINAKREFERNDERYEFLKWGQQSLNNFSVVPPATGIVHQVNLEYLAKGVLTNVDRNGGPDPVAYPDSCVGTDSHTTMVNGLGVVGWGVGGIEAEAVMLGQPIYMLTPEVIGMRLTGKLPEGATATDLVLTITQMLRKHGVVGRFVEYCGPGLAKLPVADRATIGNMAPEYGATMGFFPVDEKTIDYFRGTGRTKSEIEAFEAYFRAQQMFGVPLAKDIDYSQIIQLDLSTVTPSLSGPKRPQDRIELGRVAQTFSDLYSAPPAANGFNQPADKLGQLVTTPSGLVIGNGDVLIAAITSCTNTSNPSVLLAAGLLAKKAVMAGLKVKKHVKTSLAPGSRIVTEYLEKAGLLPYLEKLGFSVAAYGCTTCIGNAGDLTPEINEAIIQNQLVCAAVLSGNRNFEARIHPNLKANFLASPPLVVAYAIAGNVTKDLMSEPLGKGKGGRDIYLGDVWPSSDEIHALMKFAMDGKAFRKNYEKVQSDPGKLWEKIKDVSAGTGSGAKVYPWPKSSYIAEPPFFANFTMLPPPLESGVRGARVMALFGDSITTDHISPAGSFAVGSPAGQYLLSLGVQKADFNSYGARRGNHEVMMRGTFANVRVKNLMIPPQADGSRVEGGYTLMQQAGGLQTEPVPIYDAAMRYIASGVPTVVFAGEEYGTGSSRDWAAKGTALLGIKAVVARSFERIHRSNLIGMGVLPLQFRPGTSWESLGIRGDEVVDVQLAADIRPLSDALLVITDANGQRREVPVTLRIDTAIEVDYYKHGGILPFVLRQLLAA